MSLIIQSEHNDEELSSNEESRTLPRNRLPSPGEGSSPQDTQCSICLDGLTNKCYTDSCLHLFCFECLKRWSISESSCPLCKQRFNKIFHSFDDLGDHQIFNVPPSYHMEPISPSATLILSRADLTIDSFMDMIRVHERERNERINYMGYSANLYGIVSNDSGRVNVANRDSIHAPLRRFMISGQTVRIRVYVENTWALPLPDLSSSRFRDSNLAYLRNNPDEVYRFQLFIVRDLIAIRETARLQGDPEYMREINIVTVTDMIIRTLTAFEIREGFMTIALRPYLHRRASHFCHEFYNFVNSPYSLVDYDSRVQFSLQSRIAPPPSLPELGENPSNILSAFASPPSPAIPLENPALRVVIGTIDLDSDNEEPQLPSLEVIVANSCSDDSDVEILSHSSRPIESLNSASIDQPSTSTGIRDSLDRPNNYRHNLRTRRRLHPVQSRRRRLHSVQSRRPFNERSTVDSSSSDEESTNAT